MYYHTCPICGDNLDPGENCSCWIKHSEENEKRQQSQITKMNAVSDYKNEKPYREQQLPTGQHG